jgi:LPXTG-motif cell wall-anchored protein
MNGRFFVTILALTMQETPPNPNNPKFNKWRLASIAFDMGFIIALPVVVLGLLGKYLDGKFETTPWLTLAGIILAGITTSIWLTKKFKSLMTPKQ